MQYVFFGSGPVAITSFETLRGYFTFDYVVTKSTTVHAIKPFITSEKLIVADTKVDIDDFVTTYVTSPSIGVLIDFGVLISEQSITNFSHGIINSHFSLLPELRGADPITHALLRGLKRTGVSLMEVDRGMDTGDIIAQAIVPIHNTMYVDELTEELIVLSNEMLKECIPLYLSGDIVAIPQDTLSSASSIAPKVKKSDGVVTPEDAATTVDRKVRAYHGWPGVKMSFGDIPTTIEKGYIFKDTTQKLKAGDVTSVKVPQTGKILLLGCCEGIYAITQLKPDGKKSMTAEAFLAGYASKINLLIP